ncbi:MAG: ABC-F family ATP-binding cassette domain-containing protein, partial [Oscillospiraceae bacterium]|nr:ABC-F family ATP-binding cassette domain-containing protein [Oscillospiraceae bacterium]
MTDISVKGLVKSFEIGDNILDGFSFEVLEGERVGIMGKNGAGKTTLFKILTGQIDYDEGEIMIAPGKKLGLISQIPHYPDGYTVEMVLRSAFAALVSLKRRMEAMEEQMLSDTSESLLREYDALSNRFETGGGYDMDVETDKICNGLGIPAAMRAQEFDSL